MNKKIFLYLSLLLFSYQALSAHDSRPACPTKDIFSVVNEDGRKRINRVNRKLIDYYIPMTERTLGKVSYDMKPRCFKVGVNFYIEGLRILKYIEMVEKNEKLKSCSECLRNKKDNNANHLWDKGWGESCCSVGANLCKYEGKVIC